jgi:hypothetical protein
MEYHGLGKDRTLGVEAPKPQLAKPPQTVAPFPCSETAYGREDTQENQGKKTLGVHDVHRATTRPKPETCWKSIISFHEPKGEELHPRHGNCSIGIVMWRRRHANADGVRDR